MTTPTYYQLNKEKCLANNAAYYAAHKAEVRKRNDQWKEANKEKYVLSVKRWQQRSEIKAKAREKLYGVTAEQYQLQLEKQCYCCAVCGSVLDLAKNTHQDHCHVTNSPRGILCSNCNTALGLFKDSLELLLKAVSYLKSYQ